MKSCKHIWMLNLILMLSVPCLEIVIGFDERQKARLDLQIPCLDCSGEDAAIINASWETLLCGDTPGIF